MNFDLRESLIRAAADLTHARAVIQEREYEMATCPPDRVSAIERNRDYWREQVAAADKRLDRIIEEIKQ